MEKKFKDIYKNKQLHSSIERELKYSIENLMLELKIFTQLLMEC